MGLLSALKSTVRVGDDAAAAAADDAAAAADDAASSSPSFEDDPFYKRLAADVSARTAEQPARVATAGARSVSDSTSSVAKLGLGGGALYVGNSQLNNYQQTQRQESREQSFEEYQAARQQIRDNDNLSPEQKQQRLESIREAYDTAVANPSSPEDGGPLSFITERWSGLDLTGKVISTVVLLIVIQSVLRRTQ